MNGMNQNVKIINDTLQVVSFQQIRMGWIQGMSLESEKDNIFTLDSTGTIYVNADDKYSDEYVKWMVAIKDIPSKLFYTEKGFKLFLNAIMNDEIRNANLTRKLQWKDAMSKVWDAACKYEVIRRDARKKFIKKHLVKIGFGTFSRLMKGGEKNG